jgi:hypothetical protein
MKAGDDMKRSMIGHLARYKRKWLAGCALLALLGLLALRLAAGSQPVMASAAVDVPPTAPEIFASPVHAGCYLAKADRCKIHVEPFTINIASGKKLALFRLVAIRSSTGAQTIIYDWRPDQSNPAPPSGTTYTPSLVKKDFAATCGESYEISLQGRDTGDANLFNLGLTDQFTCPTGTYRTLLPLLRKN